MTQPKKRVRFEDKEEEEEEESAPIQNDHAANLPSTKSKTLPRKECILCCNDVATNHFPKLPHASDPLDAESLHSSDVCFRCYSQHLEGEVESKGIDSVRCPQCPKTLVEGEVRKLASSSTYHE